MFLISDKSENDYLTITSNFGKICEDVSREGLVSIQRELLANKNDLGDLDQIILYAINGYFRHVKIQAEILREKKMARVKSGK